MDNSALQEHLYQLTYGYPLHLELSVDICSEIEATTDKKPGIQDFDGAAQAKNLTEELVRRLLRQLTDNENDLMRLAAYPRWVSEEVLEILSSVPESVPRIFKKFIGLSMFSPHPDISEAYVIRREVRDCLMQGQRKERLFKQRHGKLFKFHKQRWEETKSFHYLQEALYHRFYENPDQAVEMFEEHFWKFLEKYRLGEAEGLLESVPVETLSQKQKRKIDYARARLLSTGSRSPQSLISARQLYETLVASETDEESLGNYLFDLGTLLHRVMAEYEMALQYLQQSLAIRQKFYGEDHPDVARTYCSMGWAYRAKGEYEKELACYNKSLAIGLKVFSENHPDVATFYNSIGVSYGDKCEYKKAIEYYEKALAIRLKVYGTEHPQVAAIYNNIGFAYQEISDCEKALEYHEKALAIRLKVYGEEHRHVAVSYNHIGIVYREKGDYDKALEYHEKGLAIALKVSGEEHPGVAWSYRGIAIVLECKDEYDKALEYHKKALAIGLKLFGEEHQNVASGYNSIGDVYYKKGEYDKALEYHKKSLAIAIKVFGEEHINVALSYRDIALTSWALKKEDEAFEKMHKSVAVCRKFKSWKYVVDSLETLAGWLGEQGKKKEAEEKRAEAQKIRKDHNLS